MTQTTDEIVALEKRLWTQADKPETFADLIMEDAINVIEPMGFITKQQVISMPAEQPWTDVQMHDLVVHQLTPDVVILAYHGQGRQGDAEPYRGSIASVYVRHDGKWQLGMSSHQPWKPTEER